MEYIDSPEQSDKELVEKILETANQYDSDMKQTLSILNETVLASSTLAEKINGVNKSLKKHSVSAIHDLIEGLRPSL